MVPRGSQAGPVLLVTMYIEASSYPPAHRNFLFGTPVDQRGPRRWLVTHLYGSSTLLGWAGPERHRTLRHTDET